MKHSLKRFLSWMLVLSMVLGFIPAVHASGITWEKVDRPITADLSDRLVQKDESADRDPGEMVRVSIVLEKPSAVQAGYATMGISANTRALAYRAELLDSQAQMEKTISARVLKGRPLDVVWNMTLVGNIISAWVPYGSLEEIASIDGVRTVAMETQYEPAVAERHGGIDPNAYPSSGMIGSGQLWNSGYTGAGSRIAVIDTGTDTAHQSFDNGAYLHALAQNADARDMSLEQYKASLDLMTEASGGNYYSLMNQGAGLARVDLAAQADSFVHVTDQEDYKVKAELGDDPDRTGLYTFDFTVTNISDTEQTYTLDADLFRQDVFEYTPGSELWLLDRRTTALEGSVGFSSANMVTDSAESHDLNGDGTTDADDADFLLEYALGNETALHGTGRIPTYSWRSIRRPLRSPSLPNRRPPWSVCTPVPRRTRACSIPWIGWIGLS